MLDQRIISQAAIDVVLAISRHYDPECEHCKLAAILVQGAIERAVEEEVKRRLSMARSDDDAR